MYINSKGVYTNSIGGKYQLNRGVYINSIGECISFVQYKHQLASKSYLEVLVMYTNMYWTLYVHNQTSVCHVKSFVRLVNGPTACHLSQNANSEFIQLAIFFQEVSAPTMSENFLSVVLPHLYGKIQ